MWQSHGDGRMVMHNVLLWSLAELCITKKCISLTVLSGSRAGSLSKTVCIRSHVTYLEVVQSSELEEVR